MKKVAWVGALLYIFLFSVSLASVSPAGGPDVIFREDARSAVYMATVKEISYQLELMALETGCWRYNDCLVFVLFDKEHQEVFVIFKDPAGNSEEIFAESTKHLQGPEEIRHFATKTVKCLYLLFELSESRG